MPEPGGWCYLLYLEWQKSPSGFVQVESMFKMDKCRMSIIITRYKNVIMLSHILIKCSDIEVVKLSKSLEPNQQILENFNQCLKTHSISLRGNSWEIHVLQSMHFYLSAIKTTHQKHSKTYHFTTNLAKQKLVLVLPHTHPQRWGKSWENQPSIWASLAWRSVLVQKGLGNITSPCLFSPKLCYDFYVIPELWLWYQSGRTQ